MTSPEQRISERNKTLLHGSVCDLNGYLSMDCVIRDAGKSGCRVMSLNIQDLPSEIILTVNELGKSIRCQVAWKDKISAGLKFLRVEKNPPKISPKRAPDAGTDQMGQ